MILIAVTLIMGMVLVLLEPAAFTRSVGSILFLKHFTFLENSIVLGNQKAYRSCTFICFPYYGCVGRFVAVCLHVKLFTWKFL